MTPPHPQPRPPRSGAVSYPPPPGITARMTVQGVLYLIAVILLAIAAAPPVAGYRWSAVCLAGALALLAHALPTITG